MRRIEEARISAGILATSGLRFPRSVTAVSMEFYAGSAPSAALGSCSYSLPPTPLFGQFGEESAFNWFTGCAPIRITGQHHDYRLLEDAQVAEDFTFDLPANVKHIIRTKLDEHGLATEEVFAWGISGDLDKATILPRMEVSVGTQLSGRRDISMSFQKWLRDPISGASPYFLYTSSNVAIRVSSSLRMPQLRSLLTATRRCWPMVSWVNLQVVLRDPRCTSRLSSTLITRHPASARSESTLRLFYGAC